ncbi:MAG: rRNA (guanine966-N2)-methyltransferase [Campylobacterota bacterium]|nr:rRNA (guanine966-N2)-methyltransferase [Campylobacterota bacterium]
MKDKPIVKKIIGGKYKNRVIKLPSKETTRSSKAIVLESFFNTIQFDIVDAIFIELFSGSGSIGLEALSRGAKKIIFMEQDRDALAVLRENIKQTDAAACEVVSGDTFANIKSVSNILQKRGEKGYFYIDPPFSIREGMDDIYDKMLSLIASLPKEAVELIIIEHMSSLQIPQNIGKFQLIKSKKFGNTSLSYLKPE